MQPILEPNLIIVSFISFISYKVCATNSHPQNVSEGLQHMPGLSKSQVWRLVHEAFDVLGNLAMLSIFFKRFYFSPCRNVHAGNAETKDVFDRYGENGLRTGTNYFEPYEYQGDPMKTYK